MSSPSCRSSKIEFSVLASHPELLAGLDAWLRLGLLSPAEVEELCRQYLVCPLKEPGVDRPNLDRTLAQIPTHKTPALSTPTILPSNKPRVAQPAKTAIR